MELNGTKKVIISPKEITFVQKWIDETKKLYIPYLKVSLIGIGIVAAIIIESSIHFLSYLVQFFNSFAWYLYVIAIILLLPSFYALGKVSNNGSMNSSLLFIMISCVSCILFLAFGLVTSSVFLCAMSIMFLIFFIGAMWNS